MEVIKESEISKLAVPWASSQISCLMRDVVAKLGQVKVNDIANKPIVPLHVDEVVRVASKCTVHHRWQGQSHSAWLQDERDDP